MFQSLVLLAGLASCSLAATVRYDWDVTWVEKSPDGFNRPVIGIDGKWPCPPIECEVGDLVVVNINNKLGNESTSLHFHGIHQLGTPHMDGPSHATQCPVPPGQSFTYSFVADQAGTYWYHSHTGSQYPDGLRAPLIVHDKKDPYASQYDVEYVLTLSDWYHEQVPVLINRMLSPDNTQIRPPLPQSVLVNEASSKVANTTLKFEPGKTYKIRVINMSALAGVILQFDGHIMKVIEVDGEYVKEKDASQIYVATAQRYSFLIEAKPDADKNFPFLAAFDVNPDFRLPSAIFPFNATGYLQYAPGADLPAPLVTTSWDLLDDFTLQPFDNAPLLAVPDETITLDFNLGFDSLVIPRAFVNNETYVHQNVPTLYTALSVGADAENPLVYGAVNPYIIRSGKTIEIVVNNRHFAHHPFHLHGHHFQVVSRPPTGSGPFRGSEAGFPLSPMRRDTIVVNGNSSVVIRFRADNPGVWLFHCHLEWHVTMGLTATIIESPLELQKSLVIPKEHLDICDVQCMPTKGNAAGNTANHTDLAGARTVPDHPDHGAIYDHSVCSTSPSSTLTPTSTPTQSLTTLTTVNTMTTPPSSCKLDGKCQTGSPTGVQTVDPCVVTETATFYVTSASTSTITLCATGAVVPW